MNVEKAAIELVRTLRSPNAIVAIILFGSQASGKARSDSDVDLLVIVQSGFEQVSLQFQRLLFEAPFVTEGSTRDWWYSNPDHCVMLWRSARVLQGSAEAEYRLRQVAATIEESGKPAMSPAEASKRTGPLPTSSLASGRWQRTTRLQPILCSARRWLDM